VLPTGIGKFWNIEVGPLILEPIGGTKVNNRVPEILSGQYRQIGWLQTDIFLLYNNVEDARSEFRKYAYSYVDLFMLPKYRILG
jgi:hypothetical protein